MNRLKSSTACFLIIIVQLILTGQLLYAEPKLTPLIGFYSDRALSSRPESFAQVGRLTFFSATDLKHGRELWATDGTRKGTYLVKNISRSFSSSPADLMEMDGIVYFMARDQKHADSLWRSDGTAAGTFLVVEIHQRGISRQNLLGVADHKLFFQTSEGLWFTDGTTKGTQFVRNIYTADNSVGVNRLFYFSAVTADAGLELWVSDGTSNGTRQVKDIWPGRQSSEPTNLVELNGKIVFTANDGKHGRELWISDGTSSGTRMLKDIFEGGHGSWPSNLFAFKGAVYFRANTRKYGYELWKSDGTPEGTRIVRDIFPGTEGSSPWIFFVAGSTLMFPAISPEGEQLWTTDGSREGTVRLSPVRGFGFQTIGNTAYFISYDAEIGYKLWKTDGTSAGTVPMYPIPIAEPYQIIPANGIPLFEGYQRQTGIELWRADPDHPELLKDICKGTGALTPENLTAHKGKLYFTIRRPDTGVELWKSDGTSKGTQIVKDLIPGPGNSTPRVLASAGDYLYFYATDSDKIERLYRTDGTAEGTILLSTEIAETGWFSQEYHGNLIFNTYNPIAIWRSDGTPEGTIKLKTFKDIYGPLTLVNNFIYFQATEHRGASRLWKTDGTAAGTTQVAPGPALSVEVNDFFVISGRTLLFTKLTTYTERPQLWKTTGQSIDLIWTSSFDFYPWELTGLVVGKFLFFPVPTNNGWELWKIDENGVLFHIYDFPYREVAGDFYELGGKLYFISNTPETGRELWVSDGTTQGTHLLKDIAPGPRDIEIYESYRFGNSLLFSLNDGDHGFEPWITDGTTDGTHLLADISPGQRSSRPYSYTRIGNTIYFIASSTMNKKQIWKYEEK